MPYVQWLSYVINLGYLGYNMFLLYKFYKERVEQDARQGLMRPLRETMELIVRPRRRQTNLIPATESESPAPGNDVSSIQQTELITDIDNNQENPRPSSSMAFQEQHDDEVTILREIKQQPDINLPYDEDRDEIFSTTSTSLESSDSNKGIIHDFYTECFICARPLDDSRKPIATLPFCMHPFHQSCIDGVLKWHPKCPVCDFHIFSPI